MKRILILILTILTIVFIAGCNDTDMQELVDDTAEIPAQIVEINSFQECVDAGNPVMESYPRQCKSGGTTFVEPLGDDAPTCEDNCGDGTCAEMVCQAIGCPCSESPESCPEDCEVKPFCGDGVCGKGEQCDNCVEDCGCNYDEECYNNLCKKIVCGRDVECNDDNACTRDICQFPMHPNAFCDYEIIEECKNNDGCCAQYCNAENDNDCEPVCGNDVCEEDENEDCEEDCV